MGDDASYILCDPLLLGAGHAGKVVLSETESRIWIRARSNESEGASTSFEFLKSGSHLAQLDLKVE